MEYYSAAKKNEISSFVETWVDLESVIQSEVSLKEKQKNAYINTLTYMNSRKMVWMNLIAGIEIVM